MGLCKDALPERPHPALFDRGKLYVCEEGDSPADILFADGFLIRAGIDNDLFQRFPVCVSGQALCSVSILTDKAHAV